MTWSGEDVARALAWLKSQPDAKVYRGVYITRDDGLHDHGRCYCEKHGYRIARLLTARGIPTYAMVASMGDDVPLCCAIVSCNRQLDLGGLTAHGVDYTLGLGEEDPLQVTVTIAELNLVARSLSAGDPLWAVWMCQVERHRRQTKSPQ